MPSEHRRAVFDAKNLRKDYSEVKNQKVFLKKRMKLIQSGWRNGVVGVEGPQDQPLDTSETGATLFKNY
jgi:hypothetical protein